MEMNLGLSYYNFCQKGDEFYTNLLTFLNVSNVLLVGVFPEDIGCRVVDHACIYRNYVVQQSQQRNVRLLKVNETFSESFDTCGVSSLLNDLRPSWDKTKQTSAFYNYQKSLTQRNFAFY